MSLLSGPDVGRQGNRECLFPACNTCSAGGFALTVRLRPKVNRVLVADQILSHIRQNLVTKRKTYLLSTTGIGVAMIWNAKEVFARATCPMRHIRISSSRSHISC